MTDVIEETATPPVLLHLSARGPRVLPLIFTLCSRGDWRTRALAYSAGGVIVRNDRWASRPAPLRHLLERLPLARRFFPGAGWRGARASAAFANGLVDNCWLVRTAALLALGECHDPRLQPRLHALLDDAFRPVRVAAAVALAASGAASPPGEGWLRTADATPERIGDTASVAVWLEYLTATHRNLLDTWWTAVEAPTRPPRDPRAWAVFLAGETRRKPVDTRAAEVARHSQERERHYHATKPFTSVNHVENMRTLHAFLTMAQRLSVPQGSLVLDLGTGPGWVSELLTRFGYRPVGLDLAPALLRIGMERLQRGQLEARMVCGDMTSLPFGAQRFEAVVVMDALHHAPDVPAVFREVFRILAPGGQFLLAEPGEGHSETAPARREVREHGVAEREIHLHEVVRYGRAAGFDRIEIVPHLGSGLTMLPGDLCHAVSAPSQEWRIWLDGQRESFDGHVLRALLVQPIVVFNKGTRARDSRAPHALRAEIRPKLMRSGARVVGTVEIENRGDTSWLCSRGEEAGRVRLGLQLITPERGLLQRDFARAPVTEDVAPGGRLAVSVDVALPDATTAYVLKLDLVDEHVAWFEDCGSKPVYVTV